MNKNKKIIDKMLRLYRISTIKALTVKWKFGFFFKLLFVVVCRRGTNIDTKTIQCDTHAAQSSKRTYICVSLTSYLKPKAYRTHDDVDRHDV